MWDRVKEVFYGVLITVGLVFMTFGAAAMWSWYNKYETMAVPGFICTCEMPGDGQVIEVAPNRIVCYRE